MFFTSLYMGLKVSTTLSKRNGKTGTLSIWKFGRLPNGWLAAKAMSSDRKMFFHSADQMEQCIARFIKQYGYINPSAKPIKRSMQLSLPIA